MIMEQFHAIQIMFAKRSQLETLRKHISSLRLQVFIKEACKQLREPLGTVII
jgi:16S rRNA U1498 N3-methylase RsmE